MFKQILKLELVYHVFKFSTKRCAA